VTRRVLLFGMGTPGYVAAEHHAGPGLRTQHFAKALAAAGMSVLVLAVEHKGAASDAPKELVAGLTGVSTFRISEASVRGSAVAGLIAEFHPDCVVATTVYAAQLAVSVDPALPLWADVFGDLMAEAQAKAAASGSDWALVHFWTLLVPVLERADHFSAVSSRQADALLGQLGLAGRLTADRAGHQLVSVIPCAGQRSDDSASSTNVASSEGEGGVGRKLRGSLLPDDALILLWSGGFNTWCDVDLMFDELEVAMSSDSSLCLVVTGGAVEGHDEASYERALQRQRASRYPHRMHFLGWVRDQELAGLYEESDLGLVVEKDLYEREFGSENRVAQWLAHGLVAVTTARSPFGRQLCDEGLALRLEPQAGRTLERVLADFRASGELPRATRRRAAAWAAEHLSAEGTAIPLVAWCRDPGGVGAGALVANRSALKLGLLSRPETSVEFLEAYLAQLSFGQIVYRVLRWAFRRVSGARKRP
jgi:glycosyltransferase involved in cell wall biosynthesis